MTPREANSANRSDTVLFSRQIVHYTIPQLLAIWKVLNPAGYEPALKKDLQKYFIERFGHQLCTAVNSDVNSHTPLTACDRQEEDSPPTASGPPSSGHTHCTCHDGLHNALLMQTSIML